MQTLAYTHEFDESTLDANRAGQITDTQIRRVRLSIVPYLLLATVTLVGVLCVVFVYPWGEERYPIHQQITAAVITSLIGLFCLNMWYKTFRVLQDLRAKQASFVDGQIKVRSYEVRFSGFGFYHRRINYFYQVNHLQFFRIPHGVHRSLIANVQYRVYYAAGSKMFLSLEPLDFL